MKKTYKTIIAIMVLILATTALSAKSKKKGGEWWNSYGGGLDAGNLIVDLGVGLNYDFGNGSKLTYYIPPLEGSVEYTVKIGEVPLGFGGYVGYTGYRWAAQGVYESRNQFYLGGLANYHFNLTDMFDIYAGLRLGVNIQTWDTTENGQYISSRFRFGLAAGATWYFTDFFGLNLELGFPTVARVAASFKLDF